MSANVVIRSGLVALVRSVRSYFETNGIDAKVTIGWREPGKQVTGGDAGRVVFQPGDDSGKAGPLTQPAQPGPRNILDANNNVVGTVRSLRNWERLSFVSVWAIDKTHPNDEELAIEAIEALFEAVLQAVHAAPGGQANAVWGEPTWVKVPTERSYGRELRAPLTFKHPMFDLVQELAFPAPQINRDLNPSS